MFEGRVVAIHIAPAEGAPAAPIDEAKLVPGAGIEGDRVFLGARNGKSAAGREVTLIEAEALAGLERDYDLSLTAAESRRNVLTEGVPLNHLVGRDFRVGECTLHGVELCEPCGYLQNLTGKKGIVKGLRHRGGLRARIVRGGTVRPGDAVTGETAGRADAVAETS